MRVGIGKALMTPSVTKVGMMGYGMLNNYVDGVETDIWARAFVFDNEHDRRIAWVNAEICFCTLALKAYVLKALDARLPNVYTDATLMITAQHTHSAPGGYSHYFFYNMTIDGFRQEVVDAYVRGIVEAIVQADSSIQPAQLKWCTGVFAEGDEVAFNRSLKAYNSNPEVLPKIPKDKPHLACDRTMKLLRIEDLQGQLRGCINWFGVHTTSISNDNRKICYDNKGYAAEYTEQAARTPYPFVAAFAQDACGDITPNFIWDKNKKWTRGKYENDFESARYNGQLQYQLASNLLQQAATKPPLRTHSVDSILCYADMSCIQVSSAFTGGKGVQETNSNCLGVSFLEGTKEGPGTPALLGNLVRGAARLVKAFDISRLRLSTSQTDRRSIAARYASQYPKDIVLDMGRGKIMAAKHVDRLVVPGALDPTVKFIKYLYKTGVARRTPWMPSILPLQLFCIGNLAIVGIPAEITTIAGSRLRHTLAQALAPKGIDTVVLSPYANAYSGYITTFEEYQHQFYEGGHTLFGRWTLAAYQTVFEQLAHEIRLPEATRFQSAFQSATPDVFLPNEIWRGFPPEANILIRK